MFSCNRPVPLGLVIVIMSPLSFTYNLQRAAYLYTSCLFVYSSVYRERLHLIFPLFFLVPAYKSRLLAFEGHSSTNLYSPGGAFTLIQPVVRAKSFPRCASRAVFHCSRSPLYLLVWMSLVASLWMYNQHNRSVSKLTFLERILEYYHFSTCLFAGCGCGVDGVGVCYFCFYCMG
jgi:hypothetical protein